MTGTKNDPSETGRIAGIDFGTVRIGVAVTDADRTIASPLEEYTRHNPQSEARYFCELADMQQITLFVVGLPVHLSGRESEKSREARQFGQWLSESTKIRVVFFDERFTSQEADRLLDETALSGKKRRARRDALAAQIMLTAFLESGQRESVDPGSLDDG